MNLFKKIFGVAVIKPNPTFTSWLYQYNIDNPDYKLLSDYDVVEKYHGLDFAKVIPINAPQVIYNFDDDCVVDKQDMFLRGNISIRVDTHTELTPDDIVKLNKNHRIFVFRHDTPNYRYATLSVKKVQNYFKRKLEDKDYLKYGIS